MAIPGRREAKAAPSASSDDLTDALNSLSLALPTKEETVPIKVPLRDYQAALLADCAALFKGGERAVLAYLPTGGGKTRVGAAAISEALQRSTAARCLFVVNRRSLLEQTRDALVELGFACSTIALVSGEGGSNSELDRARVHIAMVQSLHERFRAAHSLSQYTLAVIDECHAAAAPSYLALLAEIPRDARVLGLTATPFRVTPGASLKSVFPVAAWGPSVSQLIARRVLVPPLVYGPSHTIMPPQPPAAADFDGDDGDAADAADAAAPRKTGDAPMMMDL